MKKLFALVLLVTMISTLFVGCGKKETPATTDEAATTTESTTATDTTTTETPAKEVELRVVTMFGGTDPATAIFEKSLQDYMAQHPNVKIKNESMTAVGDEFRTQVKTDFSTGHEADVTFFFTGADAKGLIDAGKVVSYDEIWATYPDLGKDISKAVLETMKEADGKIYAMPLTGFYEGLFVNKELFTKYNLELPTTWDNLVKAVDTFKANGVTAFAGPLAQSHYMIEHFVLASAGVAEHKNKLDGAVPASWVDGLGKIKALYDQGAFAQDALTMDIELAQNLFKQEKAAMILEGSWFIGGCDDTLKAKMTVMPMPTANGNAATEIVGGYSSGYYISRSSYDDADKQAIVADLVTYLTSADQIQAIAQANGGTPSAKVVCEGLPQVALDGHAMAAAASAIDMPIDSRLSSEGFNYILNEGVPFIAVGERTAQEVLDEVKKIEDKNRAQ